MYKMFLIAVLGLSITACIKVRDPNKEGEKSQEAKIAPQQVSEITYEVEALPEPQKYLVRFKNLSSDTVISKSNNQLLESHEDVATEAGNVEYQVLSGGHRKSVQVRIPKDLIVSGVTLLSSLPLENLKNDPRGVTKRLSFDGRLYFLAGSKLVTQGTHVLIEAQSIESEGATIETLEANKQLAQNADATHGGRIYLKSPSLRGALHFVMRGEEGQLRNYNRRGPMTGYNGGNSGYLVVDIQDRSNGAITYELLPGKAGVGVRQPVSFSQSRNRITVRQLGPRGTPGRSGMSQPPCFLNNGRCEELKIYN